MCVCLYTEKLRVKNQEVLKAMSEKKKLVAELLDIPMGDYEHIAEVGLRLNYFSTWQFLCQNYQINHPKHMMANY